METIALTVLARKGAPSEAWSPLDELDVEIEIKDKQRLASRTELTAFDGRNRPYFSQQLNLDRNRVTVSFMIAGAAGQHRVELKPANAEPDCVVAEFPVRATTGIVSATDTVYPEYFRALYRLLQDPESLPTYDIAGKMIRGIFWIRDHTHCLKGLKYSAPELKAMVDYFLDHQMPGGGYYDFFHQDNTAEFSRQDNEADLEYLLVETVHTVWQATGDDAWMCASLPKLESGLHYVFTHPHRWSDEHQLLKRPFTIDTWDFEYLENNVSKGRNRVLIDRSGWLERMIDDRTKFCIMHGDNSGLAKACRLMASMHGHAGANEKNGFWAEKAEQISDRANQVCWNGQFYTHQVHIDPVDIAADESRQLSLSNAYDINRGLPSHEQAASIIREYQRRRESSGSFAEWFSIDPPFPDGTFKGEDTVWRDANEYINGTVMPLVGGELARASFEHGFEQYGVDILQRLYALLARDGKLNFMYNRDGSPWRVRGYPNQDGGPSLWGTTAVLYALMEGLAGVEDCHKLYQRARISPRWAATQVTDVKVVAGYECSQAYIAYRYRIDGAAEEIVLDVAGSGNAAEFHVLIPSGKTIGNIFARKVPLSWRPTRIENSLYADFSLQIEAEKTEVVISLLASGCGGRNLADDVRGIRVARAGLAV